MKITLANLTQATAQQVFDQVATHLLTQMERSESGDICRYRGPDGLMCAVGCLIADDEYDQEMEGNLWSELMAKKRVPELHQELILDLQLVHDMCNYPDRWSGLLRNTALNHNLTMPTVDI